ncbi:MAG: SDR family oxidoreductase [Deltaproteobacteria bacterium]|nr:SDR family oxidoreductase [Deltaproteobacteria bacterium]
MNVIVTGAASGIGRALVERMLARGHNVLAGDVDVVGLAALPAQASLCTHVFDVRDAGAWQSAVRVCGERFGGVDVLANVAGYLRPGYAHEASAEDAARHIDVNVKGVIFGAQAVLPQLVAKKSGHIVNIASLAGLSPVPGLALYSASKFAVRGYSLSIAAEVRAHGVFVTVICPDAVATPMLELQRDREEAALTFSGAKQPLTPKDVVDAFERALVRRPFEIILPGGTRAWLAKIAGAFPGLAVSALGRLRKKGLKQQETNRRA